MAGEVLRNQIADLNQFLTTVERRGLRMAELATGNRDEALDILQDAMLVFVRSYGEKPAEEWRPLFYRTLQSRIADWHRRHLVRNRWRHWFSREEEEQGGGLEQFADLSTPDPQRRLLQQATGAAILAALKKLSWRQQQVFLLRAWEGLDVEEAAAVMGCSAGSVKTHYFRALQALRGLLEEYR